MPTLFAQVNIGDPTTYTILPPDNTNLERVQLVWSQSKSCTIPQDLHITAIVNSIEWLPPDAMDVPGYIWSRESGEKNTETI